MKKRIELKVGFTTASQLSIYSAFAEVAAAALGKGEGSGPKPVTEDLSGATPEQFSSRVTSMLSM